MNRDRARSGMQPHPLASATSVDQRRDLFIRTRDDNPTSVARELLSNAIHALSSKTRSEDRLSAHEVADVPSGYARYFQASGVKPFRCVRPSSAVHRVQ